MRALRMRPLGRRRVAGTGIAEGGEAESRAEGRGLSYQSTVGHRVLRFSGFQVPGRPRFLGSD